MKNVVKITSGTYRGRTITTPGDGTHPMGERERLALFNALGSLAGDRVLDAFAGSGVLGIEALSRGASSAAFIEKSPKACKIIRENLATLGVEGEVTVGDVAKFTDETGFDLILADPPYDNFVIEVIYRLADLLKINGTLVLSHPGEAPEILGLSLEKTRQYAGAHLSFYSKQ